MNIDQHNVMFFKQRSLLIAGNSVCIDRVVFTFRTITIYSYVI